MTIAYLGLAIGAGIGALLLSRLIVGRFLNRVAPWKNVTPPSGVALAEWQTVVRGSGSTAASWLGGLECCLAYIATLLFHQEAAAVIGGWLAFKVASKWESWQNVVQVPDTLGEPVSSPLDSLRARRQWGALLYTRFLIGTLLNVLLGALIGVAVAGLGRR